MQELENSMVVSERDLSVIADDGDMELDREKEGDLRTLDQFLTDLGVPE